MLHNNLVIAVPNITDIVIQNCEQRLMPNEKYVDFVYNINGAMRIIGDLHTKKFLSEITFWDTEVNKNIWVGSFVNVACLVELTENFIIKNNKFYLSRVPVKRSLRVFLADGKIVDVLNNGNEVIPKILINDGEKVTAKYRPWMQMYVKNFVTKCKNFGFDVEQKIILEEA